MTGLALGIDLGTSGVRSAVVAPDGALIAMARANYGAAPEARRAPERWWQAVTDCIEAQLEALAEAGHDPAQITRIGVDGTSGSVVLTDTALAPVGRALMYDDAGLEEEAELIATLAPDPHLARGPGSALARALRLVAEDTASDAVHLMHQADFVAARLMGRGGATDFNNALKTGLDPAGGAWPGWLQGLPLPATLLPRAYAPGQAIAPMAEDVATALGLPATAMVHAGTTDSIAAFLAAAPQTPGAAVTSLGTTLVIKVFSHLRVDAPEMGLYAHRMRDGWLLGGASNTGGGALRQVFSVAEMEALSGRIAPEQASPFDYYPLPRPGERFPVKDPALEPRMTPRPGDDAAYLHGLLEGIARIERQCYAVLAERGAPCPERIVTTGGGAANQVWTAIRERVLGIPVVTAETPEAAVGTARLAQST